MILGKRIINCAAQYFNILFNKIDAVGGKLEGPYF